MTRRNACGCQSWTANLCGSFATPAHKTSRPRQRMASDYRLHNDQLSWLPPGVLMLQPPRSAAGQEEGQTAESQLSSASLKTPEVFRTFLQRAFLPHWSEQGHTAALATRRGCRIHLLCSLCIGKQQGKGTGDWRTQCSVSHRAGTQLARQWAGFPGTRSWAGTGLLR